MLRLHLPPNLVAAAGRDAVPLRVDLDPGAAFAPEWLPVLALIQRWSGSPTPPRFIQLSRAQLRDLAKAGGTQAIFVEDGRVSPWRHDALLTPAPGTSPASAT